MVKDERYKTVKFLIEKGHITEFNEVFRYIPKSVVANDLGTNYNRFARLVQHVEQFKVQELFMLSHFMDIDEMEILKLVYIQHRNYKNNRKKR